MAFRRRLRLRRPYRAAGRKGLPRLTDPATRRPLRRVRRYAFGAGECFFFQRRLRFCRPDVLPVGKGSLGSLIRLRAGRSAGFAGTPLGRGSVAFGRRPRLHRPGVLLVGKGSLGSLIRLCAYGISIVAPCPWGGHVARFDSTSSGRFRLRRMPHWGTASFARSFGFAGTPTVAG